MVTFDSKLNGFDIANNILINNKYITLGSCKKYSPNENSNIVYASLRVYNDLYNKNKGLFLLGKKVYIKGYLNSYSDKDIKIHNYVTVTRIEGYDFESATGPVIGVDYDGVETWKGKRMEDTPAAPEEQEEMDRMIRDIVGDDIMNNTPIQIINLTMKEDKKEIFKELIINYLLKQIKEEK